MLYPTLLLRLCAGAQCLLRMQQQLPGYCYFEQVAALPVGLLASRCADVCFQCSQLIAGPAHSQPALAFCGQQPSLQAMPLCCHSCVGRRALCAAYPAAPIKQHVAATGSQQAL
jgi:hypothetical protein